MKSEKREVLLLCVLKELKNIKISLRVNYFRSLRGLVDSVLTY